MEELYFMVWSGLKNLMWKDSIIDRNVAIYELVKNAIDARSKNIHVNFIWKKTSDGVNIVHKIEIWDDWKGMDFDDIKDKWLKVAYSAKKEGVEDKWNSTEVYAWEKWIWRFACDTLWSKLDLYATTKNDTKIHHIFVDWIDFEKDAKLKFQEIPISYEQVDKDFQQWVKISITNIRWTWTKDDLKKLKRWLSRLLAPRMAWDTSIAPRVFLETNFEDGIYKESDDIKTYYNVINGEVKNFAFSELEKKVISIHGKVSDDGTFFEASLFDKWEEIYYFKQYNEFPLIKGIVVNLSFLDRWAKKSFNALTGLHAKDFWSIFVYRNWFRILPYGSPGDDSFWIDLRKAQGYSRFLGNRELMGEILIWKQADWFIETANRDSGFIKNSSFFELNSFLVDSIIARFEKYIRAVKWYWLDEIISDEDGEDSHISKVSEDIAKVIASIGKMKWIIEFRFSESISDIITSTNSTEFLINRIKEGDKDEQIAATKKLEFKVKEFERKDKTSKNVVKRKDEELKELEKQKISLMSLTSEEFDNLISYHHQISICSDTIDNYIDLMFQKIQKNDYSKIEDYLQKIKKENSRIVSIVWFATKNGIKEKATKKERDLQAFIKNYIGENGDAISQWKINFKIEWKNSQFLFEFRPFDIAVIFDNLIKNSRIAWATKILIELYNDDKVLSVILTDNWSGFDKKIVDLGVIFQKRYSTTNGSWWWLFHAQQILQELNSEITAERIQNGAKFIINFIKR